MFGSQKNFAIIIAIIFIAIGLRVYTFSGYVGLDDAEYARFAVQMNKGSFKIGAYEGPPVFPLRVGIIMPAAFSFRLFGINEWSMILFPFITSILSVLLLFFCAEYFFGYRAGLFAAFLFALLPIDLINATRLLPDLPAAFFASLGVASILLALNLSSLQQKNTALCAGLVGGVFFGISWLIKENVIYLIPFCTALIFITVKKDFKKNAPLWCGVVVGSLGVFIIEIITYKFTTGEWFFRFHEIERNYLQISDGFFTEGSRWGWPKGGSYMRALIKRLFIAGTQTILTNELFLYTPLIGLIAAIRALYWKDKAFLVPSLWLISLLLMYNFASSSKSYYAPLALFNRYLYPIAFPAIILTSAFIERLLFNRDKSADGLFRERFFWGCLVVIFLVIFGGYQSLSFIGFANIQSGWALEGKKISNILSPSNRIYTDNLSINALEFYWKYPEKMETIDFEEMPASVVPSKGSYVFIHKRAVNWLKVNEGMWLNKGDVYDKPYFYENIPELWKVVWNNDTAILYRVE